MSGVGTSDAIDLAQKFALFSEVWSPKVVSRINNYDVKIVRVAGDFVWHSHEETDELFLVLEGEMTIQLRGRDVELGPGQLFVVPRGVEHCPRSESGAKVLLFEPEGVVNTGEAGGPSTTAAERI